MVVPESSLIAGLRGFSIFVVSNKTAVQRMVQVGVRMPGKVEVQSGVAADERIVVAGTQKLVEGMLVTDSSQPNTSADSSEECPSNHPAPQELQVSALRTV